jgi:putative hydrolase of the HAD superfamily
LALGVLTRGAAPILGPGVRAVLLDGLGTLLALAPPAPALVRWLRTEHGLRLAEAAAERAFAAEIAYYREHHHEGRDAATLADLRRRCAEVLRDALPVAVAEELSPAQLTAAMLGSLRFGVYPDVPVALAALRDRGLVLVVVSNWDVSLSAVLAEAGLAGALDGVLTSAALGAPKPAAAIFEAALALAGVTPAQAVHVGDSLANDVHGARAVGVAPVLLRRAGVSGSSAPLGVPMIASLAELLT